MDDQPENRMRDMTAEQALFVVAEIQRHLNAGAVISALTPGQVLLPVADGSVFGGLCIEYKPARKNVAVFGTSHPEMYDR